MKIGLSTLLFGGFDRDIALNEADKAGYDGVELVAIPGMGEHFHPGLADWVYDGITYTLDKAGLILESVGCGAAFGTERFQQLIEATAKMGAPYLTTSSGGEMDNEESWAERMAIIKEQIPLCESTGVKLSFKPHVRAAVHNIASAKRFMVEVGSEWIGLNIDNTHLARHGDDPAVAAKELRDWIFTARIRDFESDDFGIGPVENQIPGKGSSNVQAYWEALNEHTGLEIVTVEMVGAKDFELAEVVRVVTETIETLKSY